MAARPLCKISLVLSGYAIAFGIATVVVAMRVAATSGPAWQAYSGMLAFGDSGIFLAIFGLAAIPPTTAALVFLRSYHSFWRIASLVAACIAATGIASVIAYFMFRTDNVGSISSTLAMLSPLRILLAPLFAGFFLLTSILAPVRSYRRVLLSAAIVELVVFTTVALVWFHSS
jgi:hypothetical protein